MAQGSEPKIRRTAPREERWCQLIKAAERIGGRLHRYRLHRRSGLGDNPLHARPAAPGACTSCDARGRQRTRLIGDTE